MAIPQSFTSKKRIILSKLAIPAEDYDDLSPKGSIDVGIRELIDEINESEGWVTTSSCAGRVSVFLEGERKPAGLESEKIERSEQNGRESLAGVGGKGGGGKWLFVSHDPITLDAECIAGFTQMLGMVRAGKVEPQKETSDGISGSRFVHFKFEPMVKFSYSTNRGDSLADNARSYTSLRHLSHTPKLSSLAPCKQVSENPGL